MKLVNKYGALWDTSGRQGAVVFEQFDEESDLLGVVHEKRGGRFLACLYEKVKDPELSQPVWGYIEPESSFDELDAAKRQVKSMIANRSGLWRLER